MTRQIWRRTEEQLMTDRESALSLALQGYTHQQIADQLSEKRDYDISRKMVDSDLAKARDSLVERFHERTEMMFVMEMKRLDIMEEEAWRKYRSLVDGAKIVEEVDGDHESLTRTIIHHHSSIELGWYNKIIDVQKERRKILKMYAPTHLTLINNKKEDVAVKAYINWSPESWKSQDALEGELAD